MWLCVFGELLYVWDVLTPCNADACAGQIDVLNASRDAVHTDALLMHTREDVLLLRDQLATMKSEVKADRRTKKLHIFGLIGCDFTLSRLPI